MPADICCCCWLSLAKKRRNKKNTVFLPQCLYQGSSATGMWFSGRFVIFLFPVPPLFFFSAMFVSGKFRDGMWFSGRFVIFLFPVPPLFFFSAMFVSGKFRNGYVVFRKVYNFFVFPFLSRSSASPLSCSSVFQPPFFVLFPLFLYFYIFLSMYKKKLLCRCAEDSQSAV